MGLSKSQLITSRKSVITNACAASNVVSAKVPRYRAMNMELIELDTGKFLDFGYMACNYVLFLLNWFSVLSSMVLHIQ